METIKFDAEVRQVKSKKLITNDIEYTVVLSGTDPSLIQLALLPADCLISVTVTKIK